MIIKLLSHANSRRRKIHRQMLPVHIIYGCSNVLLSLYIHSTNFSRAFVSPPDVISIQQFFFYSNDGQRRRGDNNLRYIFQPNRFERIFYDEVPCVEQSNDNPSQPIPVTEPRIMRGNVFWSRVE